MKTLFKKSVLAAGLAATALASSAPAMARPYYGGGYGYRHHDGAAIAVGVGVLALAIGAIAASSSHHDNRSNWQWRDGYYCDQNGNRYTRDGEPAGGDGYYSRQGYGEVAPPNYGGYGGPGSVPPQNDGYAPNYPGNEQGYYPRSR